LRSRAILRDEDDRAQESAFLNGGDVEGRSLAAIAARGTVMTNPATSALAVAPAFYQEPPLRPERKQAHDILLTLLSDLERGHTPSMEQLSCMRRALLAEGEVLESATDLPAGASGLHRSPIPRRSTAQNGFLLGGTLYANISSTTAGSDGLQAMLHALHLDVSCCRWK
jgi:hypothetical protein